MSGKSPSSIILWRIVVALIAGPSLVATPCLAQTPAERRETLYQQTLRDERTAARALVAHDFVAAEAGYRRAWQTHRKIDPPYAADTATAAAGLAMALDMLDRDEETAVLLDQAIAARSAAPGGGGAPLADLYGVQARFYDGVDRARARAAYEAAIEIDRALPNRLSYMVFNLSALADILIAMSRPEEALARAGWATAIAERLGEPIPHMVALTSLARAKTLLGHPQAAIRDLRTAQALSPEPDADVLTALTKAQRDLGDYEAAAQTAIEAIAAWEAQGEDGLSGQARAIGTLADIRTSQGLLSEADVLYRRTIALAEANDDPAAIMVGRANLADNLGQQGLYVEAEDLLRRALADAPGAEGENSRNIGFIGANLAGNLGHQGRDVEALRQFEISIPRIEASLGPENPFLMAYLAAMARSTAVVRGESAADPLYRRAMTLSARWSSGHPDTAALTQDFARHLIKDGQTGEALAVLRRGGEATLARGGGAPPAGHAFDQSRGLFRLKVEAAWAAGSGSPATTAPPDSPSPASD